MGLGLTDGPWPDRWAKKNREEFYMRKRPIKNLYFHFIRGTKLDGKITIEEISRALIWAKLIEVLPDGKSYTETKAMKDLPRESYLSHIEAKIIEYLGNGNR